MEFIDPVNGPRLSLVFDDPDKMLDFFAGKWMEISSEAVKNRGFFAVALSGGKTPAPFYRKLAGIRPEIAQWSKTHIFFVDERFVPHTHADSNYRMIKETLLDSAGVPLGNVHPVPTDLPDAVSAAGRYARDIAFFFGLPEDGVPEFDLVMLGIGADGHTASLFPGDPALSEERRLVAAVAPGGDRHDRITVTLPVLNKAKNVIFLVTGREKAEVLRDVMKGGDISLPASLIAPEHAGLLFLTDAGAGALLNAEIKKKI